MPFACEMQNITNEKITKNHSLQVNKPLQSPAEDTCRKQGKVSLCSLSGSMTIECAAALPMFFLAMVIFICFLDVMRIQVIVTSSLCQSAKELGMYAYAGDKTRKDSPVGVVTAGVCMAYAKQNLKKQLKGERLTGIEGKSGGIRLQTSAMDNGQITLRAEYRYRPSAALIPVMPVTLTCTGYARAWTGYEKNMDFGSEGEENEMVYITQNQEVYHVREDCSYLELSIHYIGSGGLASARNEYGEKYRPCEKCVGKGTSGAGYYITEKGDRYHSLKTCGGLTRTVRLVKKSETGGLRPCSRCGSHGHS